MYICNEIDFIGKHFQFIAIRNCTKMSTLPTLCITGKLVWKREHWGVSIVLALTSILFISGHAVTLS